MMATTTRRPRGSIHMYGENQPNVSRAVLVPRRSWKPVDAWLADVSDHEDAERDRMMNWDRIGQPVDL